MERSKLNRLTVFCEQVWEQLSPAEQENYYNGTGVMGFVEDCMAMLHMYISELTIEQMNELVDSLLVQKKGQLYGSYIPTDDITVIFEEYLNEHSGVYKLVMRGFYYGKPDDDEIHNFYKDYEARFD